MYVVISKIYFGAQTVKSVWGASGAQLPPLSELDIPKLYMVRWVLKLHVNMIHNTFWNEDWNDYMVFDGCTLTPKMHLAIVDL